MTLNEDDMILYHTHLKSKQVQSVEAFDLNSYRSTFRRRRQVPLHIFHFRFQVRVKECVVVRLSGV